MSKYKVGDKVRVIGNSKPVHHFKIGDIVEVTGLTGFGEYGEIELLGHCSWHEEGETGIQYLTLSDIEPVTTNTLTTGQTYTSANGNKWECIFVRDDKAWLVGVFGGKAEGSAYDFDIDGTASWAGDADEYRIVFEPVRETVTRHITIGNYTASVDVTLVDGTPDWTTAKVKPV